MKYQVEQTFETLGDNCRTTHRTKAAAEKQADKLRREIASMVADMETPEMFDCQPTGYAHEIEAWESAADTAGVEYDDNNERTANSPQKYGPAAGAEIADAAVEITEVE